MTSQIIFLWGGGGGVISMGNTHTHPPPLLQLPSLITHYHHHHHHHPLLTSSDFPFSSSSSSTLWQGWVSILLFWARGRVNINPLPTSPPPHLHPPSVNTLTVKTVVLELRTKQEQNSTPRLKGAKAVGLSKKNTQRHLFRDGTHSLSFVTSAARRELTWSPDTFFRTTLGVAVIIKPERQSCWEIVLKTCNPPPPTPPQKNTSV